MKEGIYRLKNNGVGLEDPEKEFDKGTFGAELFKTLVRAIGGSLWIEALKAVWKVRKFTFKKSFLIVNG